MRNCSSLSLAATLLAAVATLSPVPVRGQLEATREELTYEPPGPSSRRSGISISEILYHPAQRSDGRELEFIELYNSDPWPEDLSGWRLSGDIAFTFPDGATAPADGYLVVGRVPADVEAEYGITEVEGPWSNNLPNQGGRVRLRKPSGAIVQEVNYNDRPPWPLASDGAGHSLVLVRPSYGEADPHAWEASHSIGGSPGLQDRVPSDLLDHVFVAAALTNSEPPEEDFIELRNAAGEAVDLSGCMLSDARDTLALFRIPDGTSIPGHGTWRVLESELGFALDSEGDAIYLTNADGTRVLDAVVLPPAATGIPFARLRSDAPLRPLARPQIVINELMFHAPTHDESDEWIEIHNRGAEPRDLSGWAFTDGISFAFPQGTQIAASGFLVIARDRARTLANHPALDPAMVLGDYDGDLSNAGERIELARPDGEFLVAEDVVNYADSNRWHRFSDGRGASLERINPGGDSLAPSNWADSDESAKAEWTTVEATGTLAHGNSSAPADQVQMFLLGPGEAMVDGVEVVEEGGSNLVPNGSFERASTGWFFQGTHRNSMIERGDAFDGVTALRLVATRRGDTGPNRARAPLARRLDAGTRATLRARVRWLSGHPEFLMRLKGNWLEAPARLALPTNLGTPGAVNSRASRNGGPHIDSVRHRPLLPQRGEEITITAEVADPDGVGAVTLRYRLDPSPSIVEVPMRDDGAGPDQTPGDGIFSAIVPGQNIGALVAFQIVAEDAHPERAASEFPPQSEGLVRVGDPRPGRLFGAYRMWISDAALADWNAQPFRNNDPFPITFIYNDSRVVYGAGAYYGGNRDSHGHPLSGLVGYDVRFPPGDEILGADKLTLDYPVRDPTNQREQLMHWFADQLHLPTLHRRDIYLYMNGTRRGTIYHDAEQPDSVVVNSHFPGDDGELFKTSNDNETTDGGTRIRPFVRNLLQVFEADGEIREARYRWTTAARARGSRPRLDMTSIVDLVQRADDRSPAYQERLLEVVDMENWMRTFALIDLASFWDAFGNPNWKNTYIYKPDGGRWVQFTWDFDVGLGVFNDPPNQQLFPTSVDPNIQRMYRTPAFVREYWRAMDESLRTFFSPGGVARRLEARHAAYEAAGLGFTSPFVPSGPFNLSIRSWIQQRAAFIQGELQEVDASFALRSPTDGSTSGEQTIVLTGNAPVRVATIEVNGIALDPEWSTVSDWSASFVLQSGTNQLQVRALAADGSEVASAFRTVTYSGPGQWPPLLVNEWMASNQTALADPADGDFNDWFEIFNPGNEAVDLSGWFLSDDPADPFRYRIPPGFSVPANGFLLVWADEETAQNDLPVRPDLHVSFRLDAEGESVLLTAPDGTPVDRVDFGPQSIDKTMGRVGDEVVALASPSAGSVNGRAAVAPSLTVIRQGGLVRIVSVAEPGFRYAVESSEDLVTWEPFDNVVAESDEVEFSTIVNAAQRFVRVRRVP